MTPTAGPRAHPRSRRGDVARARPHRLPAGAAVLLRLPDRARAARVLRGAVRLRAGRPSGARRRAAPPRAASTRPRGTASCGSSPRACCSASGLAQALVNDPELVVLDEPMSGLDPIGRRQVRDLIAALRAAGVTVFFSSHIIADIEVLCDRVAILQTRPAGAPRPPRRAAPARGQRPVASRSPWSARDAGRAGGRASQGRGRAGDRDAGRRAHRRAVGAATSTRRWRPRAAAGRAWSACSRCGNRSRSSS